MSYPQPSADTAVTPQANDIFRLTTPLVSPGDVYQLTQSGYSFAVGPESDINLIQLNYFDQNAPAGTYMNQAIISPECPFTGEIVARNDNGAVYQPSRSQGLILASPANVVPYSIYNPSVNGLIVTPPTLDLIAYLQQPTTSLPAKRRDKEFNFTFGLTTPYTGSNAFIFVPVYGRKRIQVATFSYLAGLAATVTVTGYNYPIGQSAAVTGGLATTLTTGTAAGFLAIYTADTSGQFDYISVELNNTSSPTLSLCMVKINVSDTP